MDTSKDIFLNRLGQTSPFPFLIEVSHADGSYIYDTSGKAYLDMIAGVAVNNIGHRHPKVISAINHQLDKHMHVMVYGEFIQSAQNDFGKKLTSLLPPSLNAVYAVNSGTEANEAAIKLAKRVTGRTEIISCIGAYHGSTNGSLSISANEVKKTAFRPLLPDIRFIKHNDLADLSQISTKTAAVIIEPIQGDAGVRIADEVYLQTLRKVCDDHGVLLIYDEIQCGMGRTGKLFAFEHYPNAIPDILTLGKALGGGMPIGALVANQTLLKTFTEKPMLGHITTFGGHPVICAAANACLAVLEYEIDWSDVKQKGDFIAASLETHPLVHTIRHKGLMFAIDLTSPEQVNLVVKYCLEDGLIAFWFLSHPYSFRLSPPLNISMIDCEKAVNIILNSFDKVYQLK
ncbi:MAG: aspartate aminotransferase family protein [Crocinitomicaceae bacterium]|nr:aspartate aminotransferase family protein [Crocinitomicaceae bacterium]